MENSKQTAVEWLLEQHYNNISVRYNGFTPEQIEQAKSMEKEQRFKLINDAIAEFERMKDASDNLSDIPYLYGVLATLDRIKVRGLSK